MAMTRQMTVPSASVEKRDFFLLLLDKKALLRAGRQCSSERPDLEGSWREAGLVRLLHLSRALLEREVNSDLKGQLGKLDVTGGGEWGVEVGQKW